MDPSASTQPDNNSQPFNCALEHDEPISPGVAWESDEEHEVASAVSQIELQLALQLPAYCDAVKWNPESCARLTRDCFILQDWDIRKSALQVYNQHRVS